MSALWISPHIKQKVKMLTGRIESYGKHVFEDSARLEVETIADTGLQQMCIGREVRSHSFFLHPLTHTEDSANMWRISMSGEVHVVPCKRCSFICSETRIPWKRIWPVTKARTPHIVVLMVSDKYVLRSNCVCCRGLSLLLQDTF